MIWMLRYFETVNFGFLASDMGICLIWDFGVLDLLLCSRRILNLFLSYCLSFIIRGQRRALLRNLTPSLGALPFALRLGVRFLSKGACVAREKDQGRVILANIRSELK